MSEKPLAERLQVKRDRTVAVAGAPAGLRALAGLDERRAQIGKADVLLLFAGTRAELEKQLKRALETARHDAIVWAAYPKLSSSRAKDLSRDVVREIAQRLELDTVSQIAVDDDWSALRLKRV